MPYREIISDVRGETLLSEQQQRDRSTRGDFILKDFVSNIKFLECNPVDISLPGIMQRNFVPNFNTHSVE